MKKRIVFLVIMALCLIGCASALAEDVSGQGAVAVQNDGLAAYVDGSGNLYIPGNDEPINENSADAIISIDSYRLTFLSVTDEGTDDEQTALVVIDLTTFEESVVDSSVYAACMIDDDLYYVSDTDRTQLYLADFENDLVNLLYTSEESIDGLYESVDGLVVTFVEDAGAVLYVETTDSFEPYGNETPEQSAMTEDYQVYIADGSTLYIQEPDSLGADTVDTNVFSFTLLNDKIYYLANTGSAVRLKVYDPEELEQKVLLTLEISIDETQLAASQTMLFLLGDDDVVYSVDPDTGDMEAFLTIQAPELSDDTQVDSYFIEGMNGQINVYATLTDAEETPTFSFMEFTTDVDNVSEDFTLVKITQIDGEDLAWTLLEPAEQYTPLSRGSRGDAVSAIQQPLYDHGYYDYYIDGIFGIRTDRAVRLLQEDLGLTVNGIADEELQKIILSGDFPDYDPYAQIDYGDRGLRVKSMQQRLRSLGYLADAADGIFGVRTQAAVQLFQLENDITVSENATRETLVALYSSSASKCSSYIELKLGDTGYRVRELNKRLKELYYLEGSVTDTYTSATADAIRLFQAQVGLVINGNEASTSLQQRLFASGAPEYSGYITLRRGDESARVARLQRRLKELNYFSGNITGYYGSKTQAAVKLFQQTVGIRPTGVATVRTQELLFSPYAQAYVKPTVIGTPTISLDGYDKLESGVYCLSETSTDSGYVTFSWYAEGDVESYNVTIIDDQGTQYLDQDTMLTMTSVQVATLSMDRVYTITITAYPSDGDTDHITSAALSFKRIEASDEDEDAIGTITSVTASIDDVTRTEDDVNYVRTGTITFRWYAEGDVASYYVEIIDASGNVLLNSSTTDEQASTTTDSMSEGAVYSLCVYAIPTNGTKDDAVVTTLNFALDDQADEIPTVDAPNVTIDGLTADSDGAYTLTDSSATLVWDAVENAEQYYIEVRDANNTLCFSDTTTVTTYELTAGSLTAGASYTVSVTAIPTGGSVDDGSAATITITLPQTDTITQLSAPTLTISNAEESDGIYYVSGTELEFQWTSVDGASSYNVVIRDSNNSICSETNLSQLNTTYDGSSLTRGATYTVSVTAVAEDDTSAQGTAATLTFIIKIEEDSNVLTTVSEDPTASDDAFEDTEEATAEAATADASETDETEEAETVEVTEDTEDTSADETVTDETVADETVTEETSANEITAPEISISPVDEISDNVTYVQDGIISFTWHSDGDLSGYRAEILDANGNVLTSVDTESEGASLDSNNLTAEAIYTIRVTAIPADGTAEDGVASEAYFAKHETVSEEAEEQVEDTTSEEVTEDASEETTAEEAAEETTTETTGEDTAESTEESASEPTEEPVEETTIGSVSAPTVEISPNVGQQDSVTYVESGTLTLSWYADGEVASYRIEILESDTVLATLDTTDTSTNLSTGNMVAGTAYVLRVTAIPTGGTIDNGVSTELLFALVNTVTTETESEEDAAETTEDAADETTVEEASEPAEEPAAEPTEEPAAEQAEEPAAEEETVEEPVEESTDEQTDETVTDEEKWQTPIDETSDPELITELQQRLVDLGWLEAETYTIGTLDEATITAVLNFQNNYNLNYGGTLELIDSELPVIQVETLTLLMLTTE